jgi:hypothetical protein
MTLPVSFVSQVLLDNTVKANGEPESASYALPVTTLTAANYVAKKALIDVLTVAVGGVTLGNVKKTEVTILRDITAASPPSNIAAQRENKLLIRYHDAITLQKYRASIPTFDLTTLPAHSEFLDLTAGVGQALKDAFEAIVVSPGDSANSVVLDSAQFVGRNT